jgi:hypothetical protein
MILIVKPLATLLGYSDLRALIDSTMASKSQSLFRLLDAQWSNR